MSTSSYLVAWLWYLGAVVVLIGVWWYWTRKLPTFTRNLTRVLPVAWALTPWTVTLDHERLAPAWLVAIFEGLLREQGSGWRAGIAVLLSTLLAVSVVALLWWRERRQLAGAQASE